jgi:hypothetical protein
VIINKTVVDPEASGRPPNDAMQDATWDWVNGLSMIDGSGELLDAMGAGLGKLVEAGSPGGFIDCSNQSGFAAKTSKTECLS